MCGTAKRFAYVNVSPGQRMQITMSAASAAALAGFRMRASSSAWSVGYFWSLSTKDGSWQIPL